MKLFFTKILCSITFFLFIVSFANGQSHAGSINRVWGLVSTETLSAIMADFDEEMKTLDLSDESKIIFGKKGDVTILSYKISNDEILLYDNVGNPVGNDVIWKIERVDEQELVLRFIVKENKMELVRLRYKPQGW
jgi:hypothetical protein